MGVEGTSEGRWVLLDFSDVVAHVFLAPVRERYDIDGLWSDVPVINPDEEGNSSKPGPGDDKENKAGR